MVVCVFCQKDCSKRSYLAFPNNKSGPRQCPNCYQKRNRNLESDRKKKQRYRAIHKEQEAKRRQAYYRTFKGHIRSLYWAISKNALKNKIPTLPWKRFRDWAMNDKEAIKHHQNWENHNYDEAYTPWIIIFDWKVGYVPGEMMWEYSNESKVWLDDILEKLKNPSLSVEERTRLNMHKKTAEAEVRRGASELKKTAS